MRNENGFMCEMNDFHFRLVLTRTQVFGLFSRFFRFSCMRGNGMTLRQQGGTPAIPCAVREGLVPAVRARFHS